MRKVLLFSLLIFSASLKAQPGLFVSYHNLESSYWNLIDPSGPRFFQHGFGAGFQYRIPFYGNSFAFLPSLGYGYFEQMTSENGLNKAHYLQLRGGIRAFPMEFLLDCDCPVYKKGVFAEAFLGWSRWDLVHKEADVQVADVANAPLMGLGAGVLIPFGKHVVISPIFRYTYYPSVTWEGLNTLKNPNTDPFFREETFFRQMSFEIHVQFER
ncbi:MAG: hypothetical protein IPH04_09315 [Saprospirales bacterium]|nr:hypothetical protein [Saprospirales bacterium]MBK6902992.1 hypothetical protein [Saprospirales bacterium]